MADLETQPKPDAKAPPLAADPAKAGWRRAWGRAWGRIRGRVWRRPSGWAAMVAVLVIVLAALLAGAALLLVTNNRASDVAAQRQVAMEAAASVAVRLSTVSSDNARQQLDSLTQDSTGAFRDQISGTAAAYTQLVQMGRVTSKGVVTGVGIETIEPNTATALVSVRATVATGQAPQGVQRSHRISVQLQREGGRWLASNVVFVP